MVIFTHSSSALSHLSFLGRRIEPLWPAPWIQSEAQAEEGALEGFFGPGLLMTRNADHEWSGTCSGMTHMLSERPGRNL